ncbi:MAG: LytTR family DNA-binding domain-containing protein [Lachnospiraceae bacterium]
MRIAIVDDEDAESICLNKMLKHWADINRIDISCDYFLNGNDFLTAVSRTGYDMVFMDIYMNGKTGIQTAVQMRSVCPECCLIFLTSSQEHMPQAFPCHAFDYLLKPLNAERLFKTLSDFLNIFPENQRYINLNIGKQMIPVLYSHLEYIMADSNYCIVQAQEKFRCRMQFSKLTELLEEDGRFVHLNRGICVNLDFVESMEGLTCYMKNKVTFPINTKKKSELKQALISHRFNIRRKQLSRR